MRLETLLKICNALNITPNDILSIENDISVSAKDIADAMTTCSNAEKETALKLLRVYIESLK